MKKETKSTPQAKKHPQKSADNSTCAHCAKNKSSVKKSNFAEILSSKMFGRTDTPHTAQQSIPYREIYRDGICKVKDNYYTKTVIFNDINYQLAQKVLIFKLTLQFWTALPSDFESCYTKSLSLIGITPIFGSAVPVKDGIPTFGLHHLAYRIFFKIISEHL